MNSGYNPKLANPRSSNYAKPHLTPDALQAPFYFGASQVPRRHSRSIGGAISREKPKMGRSAVYYTK